MGRFFDPDLLARTYRDPLALASLGVDLLPLVGIFLFGWGAAPLVALYWLENLVIGGATIARMAATGMAGPGNMMGALFLIPFFTFHYGMFCWGHGTFLAIFASGGSVGDGFRDLLGWALGSGAYMPSFVAAIAIVSALFFVFDFLAKGQFRDEKPITLMFLPYGRIVVLHIAILLGAVAVFWADEPLIGVLGILALRFVFGIVLAVARRLRLDGEAPWAKALTPPV